MNDYINGNLNPSEQALYNSNKANALLCMGNGKLATEFSEARYASNVLHNGNGDAFRHALWNFGMARDVGVTFAKKWSDAHENGIVKQQPAIERSMDLYNNSIGLNLANSSLKPLTPFGFADITQAQVRAGNLKIISNGSLVPSNSAGEK